MMNARTGFLFFAMFAAAIIFHPVPSHAQNSGLSATAQSSILRQLQSQGGLPNSLQSADALPTENSDITFPGQEGDIQSHQHSPGDTAQELTHSLLEQDFKRRIALFDPRLVVNHGTDETHVPQFGYDAFVTDANTTQHRFGSGRSDYILGVGDEVVVTFRGQISGTNRYYVDRSGRVVVPELPPVAAVGRRFVDFRSEIEAMVGQRFLQTEVFVSLGQAREIAVQVTGASQQPGVVRLSGLASLTDLFALGTAPTQVGSLRAIELIRDGRRRTIDLYDVLMSGGGEVDLALQDGDRVHIPRLGATVAVAGEVREPGVFEFSPSRPTETLADVVGWAGGTLRAQGYRFILIRQTNVGVDSVSTLLDPSTPIGPSDIIIVLPNVAAQIGSVSVLGNVGVPGPRSIVMAPTVGALVRQPGFLRPDSYMLFGVVVSVDPVTRNTRFIALNLADIVTGRADRSLNEGDTLVVLSSSDVDYLADYEVQSILAGEGYEDSLTRDDEEVLGDTELARSRRQLLIAENSTSCVGLRHLAGFVEGEMTRNFASAVVGGHAKISATREECPAIYETFPELLPFLAENSVLLKGAVRSRGVYPISNSVGLDSLIATAGGLQRSANLRRIAVASFGDFSVDKTEIVYDGTVQPLSAIQLNPGDTVRVDQQITNRESAPVRIFGEVVYPGYYTIRRDETLSELIARAGGLTDHSYPLGTVFTRESIREREREALQRAAVDLERSAFKSSGTREEKPDPAFIQLAIERMRSTEPIGRLVVEADPAILAVRPELDSVLQGGDEIFVPKRPSHVYVGGEVLHAGAQQYRSGLAAQDYIEAAGGETSTADSGRIFIILPNGSSRPVTYSAWNFERDVIPPGSAVVVPLEVDPFNFWSFARISLDLVSSAAVTAASVAVIGRD